ncbi:UvrD-helicase domain-containing protein [Shewanella sp. SM32]|uniref:UvrD-helicase domain-containing protein n=1 Tax=Shewanella sp. SM32 TaxID=2912796 RepID=UPI0021DAE95E|nr:ATP-dependent helicase [Shewanella sp. SM32]MCU8072470.1 ATP-dependent helicase [Shewanella sp. SM32]
MPYKKLTDEQLSAVIYPDDMLLSACPGSGKTKTLVSKLYHILDNSDSYAIGKRKVVALTYTNIAADTITERLLSYGVESKSLWVGTIHAFCLQWIIRPNINKISRLCGGFIVIDEHEKEAKIIELKERYDFKHHDEIITTLNKNYQPVYQQGTKKYALVKEYHKYLAENDYIDFDLILNISYRLLYSDRQLTYRLGKLLYHILVDEYQDTSEMQYEILKLIIIQKQTKITLIGDKEQAIYTGLGAIVKNKNELKVFFELSAIEEKRLTGCFRSSQKIVDHYLRYQDSGYEVKAVSELSNFPSTVHLESNIDKTQLAQFITGIVETHLKQGILAKNIAVVSPSWFDVMELSKDIDAENKSFDIDGFLISPIPKNQDNLWLSLIRLTLTKPDVSNFIKRRRLANDLSVKLFESGSTEKQIEPKLILKTINSISLSTDTEIEQWIKAVVRTFCDKLSISLLDTTMAFKAKCSILEATKVRIDKYQMSYKASDLGRFFSSSCGVKITTCHSTKGDEYDVIICTGLLEGKVPHWNDIINCSRAHQNYVLKDPLINQP